MSRDDLPYPETGLLLTHFLTVADVARSRAFYADVLGGEVVLAENPCIVKLANGWIIMNPGGGPTPISQTSPCARPLTRTRSAVSSTSASPTSGNATASGAPRG